MFPLFFTPLTHRNRTMSPHYNIDMDIYYYIYVIIYMPLRNSEFFAIISRPRQPVVDGAFDIKFVKFYAEFP